MAIIREERIGGQRLILGDCLEVMKGLDPFDHIFSDPPYEQTMHDLHKNAEYRRTDGGADRKHFSFKGIDELRPDLISWISKNCNGWFLAFCTAEGVAEWRKEIVIEKSSKFKTTCAWIKPDCAPKFNGQGPAVGYEPFITVWSGKGHSKWNAGGKRGIYTHTVNPRDRHGAHPTEKPWRLFVEILQDFSSPEQSILDPFMGSGTTLVACEKIGRKGTGIELDPEYFNIACERVEAASKQDFFYIDKSVKYKQEGFDL